jgi:hypothetical protein
VVGGRWRHMEVFKSSIKLKVYFKKIFDCRSSSFEVFGLVTLAQGSNFGKIRPVVAKKFQLKYVLCHPPLEVVFI